jgi:deoxyribodipyrimidine photolyase-related protein
MDRFDRPVRRRTGFLMKSGKPEGGRFSFDPENRRPWRGQPPAPEPPRFACDAVQEDVGTLVAERFSDHPGELDLDRLPATQKDAEKLWRCAKRACLPSIGPFVWRKGWSHHITRLMVFSNLAMLLDVSPRTLCDWFWVACLDAYDWVVEPNVLGMGSFAFGELFTTKPYVSGAGCSEHMSDYCAECPFSPRRDCPWTPLDWAFLARHRERLAGNPRLAMPYRGLARRKPAQSRQDAETFERVSATLARGESLAP